jgi:hypothetical protein
MRRLYGALRVLGLAILVLGIVTTITLRKAQARFVESLSGFGLQIARLQDLSPDSAPRRMMLNGLELHVMTVSTSLDVKTALDRFQSVCHAVGQIDMPATVRQKLESGATLGSSKSLGVVRKETKTEGTLACVDVGEGLDVEGFLGRLKAFGETMNLRSLGQYRYTLARRTDSTTTLVVFWTDGNVKLTEMFPEQGDAPGQDLAGIPRPAEATRTLSACESGKPYGLAYYRLNGKSKRAVLVEYEALLKRTGFSTSHPKPGVLLASKQDRNVVVNVLERKEQQVMVGVSDLVGPHS